MRLIFDQMLGRAAKWCRILGIDSLFYEGGSDSELLERAKKGKLVLLTRDVRLAERAKKAKVRCILVESADTDEQVAQIIKGSGIEPGFPESTRCPVCNGILKKATKKQMKGKVPEDILKGKGMLWECAGCGKAYWEGSHWKNIKRFYDRISSS